MIPKELPFGDKDTKSKVTLLECDHVRFNISTDRRDKLERATNIEVLPNSFQFTNEVREMVSILCIEMKTFMVSYYIVMWIRPRPMMPDSFVIEYRGSPEDCF